MTIFTYCSFGFLASTASHPPSSATMTTTAENPRLNRSGSGSLTFQVNLKEFGIVVILVLQPVSITCFLLGLQYISNSPNSHSTVVSTYYGSRCDWAIRCGNCWSGGRFAVLPVNLTKICQTSNIIYQPIFFCLRECDNCLTLQCRQ